LERSSSRTWEAAVNILIIAGTDQTRGARAVIDDPDEPSAIDEEHVVELEVSSTSCAEGERDCARDEEVVQARTAPIMSIRRGGACVMMLVVKGAAGRFDRREDEGETSGEISDENENMQVDPESEKFEELVVCDGCQDEHARFEGPDGEKVCVTCALAHEERELRRLRLSARNRAPWYGMPIPGNARAAPREVRLEVRDVRQEAQPAAEELARHRLETTVAHRRREAEKKGREKARSWKTAAGKWS
jgi:hypothetical protein